MLKKWMRYTFIATVIGVLLLAVATIVSAQTVDKPQLDLTVFPSTTYLSVKPGKEITHRVLLQYTGDQPIQLTPRVRDFIADGKTGIPVIQDSVTFSSISLANPDKKLGEPFVLAPNTKFNLDLLIKPDAGQLEKEYHLVLLLTAEPLPDRIGQKSGAVTSGVIGSNIILTMSETGENQGKIEINKFPMPRLVDSFGHIAVAALAENTGTTATVPKGTITLNSWQGKKLKEWFIFPDVVLADSTRLLRAMATDPALLKEGDTPKLIPMEYDAPFLIGPYTVTTQLEKPDGTTEQHTITVVALPFSIIAGILAIVGLYVGYRYSMSRLNAKKW